MELSKKIQKTTESKCASGFLVSLRFHFMGLFLSRFFIIGLILGGRNFDGFPSLYCSRGHGQFWVKCSVASKQIKVCTPQFCRYLGSILYGYTWFRHRFIVGIGGVRAMFRARRYD